MSRKMAGGASRWRLDGKKALVTGGTKGIGRAIVDDYLELGAEVFVTARSAEDVAALVAEKGGEEGKILGGSFDASKAEDRTAMVEAVSKAFDGELHILVNNVGTNIRHSALKATMEEYNHIMNSNLASAFEVSQLCHPLLKKAGSSCVLMNSSVAGVVGLTSGSIYGMSKAAMNQLTRVLSCEWASDGIRVNAICPWYTNTPLASPVLNDPEKLKIITDRTPLDRVAQPEEVSSLFSYLAMDCSSYVTGQSICVDGGFTINGNFKGSWE